MTGAGTLEPVDVALHEAAIAPIAVLRMLAKFANREPESSHCSWRLSRASGSDPRDSSTDVQVSKRTGVKTGRFVGILYTLDAVPGAMTVHRKHHFNGNESLFGRSPETLIDRDQCLRVPT